MAPFVGRVSELQALRGLISGARLANLPAAGLVIGEPGRGKSRLLREALVGLDPKRTVLLTGFEPTEPIPLAAAGELLRRLSSVPGHGARLADMAFGGGDRSGEGSLVVFEAANRALGAFGPLVVAVDDLQWVDPQTVALLYYLVSAAESARRPLVVIAASRPSATALSFHEGMVRPINVERGVSVDLQALDMTDGVALALAIDPGLGSVAAAELWRRADGSPFWLEALARSRHATDAAGLIADRLRALSADSGTLLRALVVGARPLVRDELVALLDWSTERLEQAARELVGRGLAISEHETIRLAHDLIREAAADLVPAATRRTLHARFAGLIDDSEVADLRTLAEALDHRVAAGLPTAALAIRLASSPQRRLLGADQLTRLSTIADGLAAGSRDQRLLDRDLARLAAELGEYELSLRHWNRVATAEPDTELRQQAEQHAARAAYEAGKSEDAEAHLRRARTLPTSDVRAIELDALEAELELDRGRVEPGRAAANRALERARGLAAAAGDAEHLPTVAQAALHTAVQVAANVAWVDERTEDLIALTEESLAIAETLGDERRLETQLFGGQALRQLGRLVDSAELFGAAWETSQRLMLPVRMAEAGFNLAGVLYGLGHLAEARSIAHESDAVEARIHPWALGKVSRAWHALVELALGEPGSLERFDAVAPGLDQHRSIGPHQAFAVWFARRDGTPAAPVVDRLLAGAQAAAHQVQCPRCAAELRVVSAELLARTGRIDDASRELAGWEAGIEGGGHMARAFWRAQARAAIAVASGAPDARAVLERLATSLEDAGRLLDATWARLDLGRLLDDLGDRPGAIAAFTAAASLASATGAVDQQRIAARALRRLGVRTWRRGHAAAASGGLAALSGRERQVAGLVAGGATNAEVAEALAIAPKTVERHVTNILAKLGARNRTELAAQFSSPGTGFSG